MGDLLRAEAMVWALESDGDIVAAGSGHLVVPPGLSRRGARHAGEGAGRARASGGSVLLLPTE